VNAGPAGPQIADAGTSAATIKATTQSRAIMARPTTSSEPGSGSGI
jgi:hypothetical protein